MTSDAEKATEINEVHIEDPTFGNKDSSTFIYEDPKTAPKRTAAERRLVLKVDLLIVGLTSLVFLVNQWASDVSKIPPMSLTD
jgi:hypothetical protein